MSEFHVKFHMKNRYCEFVSMEAVSAVLCIIMF